MPAPVHFEIHAEDLARARTFYGEVFGWKFTKYELSPAVEYWLIDTGEPGAITGGLLGRPGSCQPGQAPNAFVVTIGVPDIIAYLKKAIHAGAAVAMPKMAIPGIGWQAYLIDPEKNIIGLHQRDPAAI
jgi:predicted enzyme related to lactoylglutathione lyase